MKPCYIILAITSFVLTISACKKKDDTLPPTVYVAANTNSGATLWKNGVATNFPDSTNAFSQALFVSGADVYQCGYYGSPLNKATYWKNGVPTYLTNGTTQAMALDICVSGTDVHVVGFQSNGSREIALYWKNGVPTVLSNGTFDGRAISISVSGSDVYILIQETNGSTATARYWKNGVETILTDPSLADLHATDMYVHGSDVYVSGYGDYNMLFTVAKYWKNGVRTNLGAAVYDSKASSIFVSGTDVYVAGWEGDGTHNMPTCWKNGTAATVSDGSQNPFVDYIFVHGNDVYLAGHQGLRAKYWKNGVPVILGAFGSIVSGIVVK
ncbi:MAG: hypothetical protein KA149_00295 [Chitinophagales bacterium]|nr:hypothetical protein [Chitinophagales bacterium]